MEASRNRLKGYRQALAAADLPFDPELTRDGNWQPVSGYERTRELMRLPAPPTAIFCANDLMAIGCYEALLGNVSGARENLHISFRMDRSFRELAKKDPDLQQLHDVL